ncbi:hypothetical protein [Methylomicrobium lacus]|uniref:hypothetical protein n=1 Tax=Methylomicrobium lacus TaxID=136992 RepID=UPI00045E9A4D|nr:hypothetical protein [Methylomicrobium lacus]
MDQSSLPPVISWLFESVGSIPTWLFSILAALITVCGNLYANKRNRIAQAAVPFRSAIDPNAIDGLQGHTLHGALLGVAAGNGQRIEGVFHKHKRAYVEFRRYLYGSDLNRLDTAWYEYVGNNEESPDFFVMYCGSEDKSRSLKNRLETLRDAGSHT